MSLRDIKLKNMNKVGFTEKLEEIRYQTKGFDEFKNLSNIFIQKFKKVLDDFGFPTFDIIDNSLEFIFWGLNFIIKAEITFSPEEKNFVQGEINTYLQKNDLLIQQVHFDNIGNTECRNVLNDFAEYYFIDFVKNLKTIALDKKIKFQLK